MSKVLPISISPHARSLANMTNDECMYMISVDVLRNLCPGLQVNLRVPTIPRYRTLRAACRLTLSKYLLCNPYKCPYGVHVLRIALALSKHCQIRCETRRLGCQGWANGNFCMYQLQGLWYLIVSSTSLQPWKLAALVPDRTYLFGLSPEPCLCCRPTSRDTHPQLLESPLTRSDLLLPVGGDSVDTCCALARFRARSGHYFISFSLALI